MADDKEIRIRAVLDASTFDKGVNEIQEKLKKLTQQQTQGAGTQKQLGKDTVLGKYAQQVFGDFSKESQKQLEQMYQTQRREAVNQSVTLKGKQQELDKMLKTDTEMTKQQKQRLDHLKKEIDLLKEKHRLTLNTAAETQKALDKMKPEGPAEGGAGGPPQQPPQPGGFGNIINGIMKNIGVAAIIKGAVNAAVMGAEDLITRDRKIAMNNAQAMNSASREMREQFQGRGSRGMFWLPERTRAMRNAAEEQSSQSMLETAKAWGGTALQVGGAATIGLTGWTGIGAGVGLGMMGVGTALKGGIVGDERTRAAMFDREKFRSMMTKEGMEKYEQNLAAEKAKDPRKAMAQEYFEQNHPTMMRIQKQLGMGTDAELMGGIMSAQQAEEIARNLGGGKSAEDIRGQATEGWLQRQMRMGDEFGGAKFNQATIEEQIQALSSGGAMTEGMRGMAGQAAAYNRQFNLTNAGNVMGKIQGNTAMTSKQTDEAYKRIMAEAVRLGVDTSTMPKEMERMTQLTSELITAGGVEAKGMGEVFGAGVYDFSKKSMEAAAGAAETFKAAGKEAGGFEGQMGMGFLQSKKAEDILGGKKLGAKELNYLNQLSYTELDEAGFERVGEALGIDKDKAKELLKQKDIYKQSRTGAEEDAYKNLGEFLKAKGPMSREEMDKTLSTGEGAKLFTQAEMERTASRGQGFMGKDVAARRAEVLTEAKVAAGAEKFEIGEGELTPEQKVEAQLKKKETRAGAIEEGAEATGEMARMEALNEQIDALKTAAQNHTKYAEQYNVQFQALVSATKSGADSMEAVADQLSNLQERIETESLFRGSMPTSSKPAAGK